MRASAKSKSLSPDCGAAITCKRLAPCFPVNSQPLIKSILSLESGDLLKYASIRQDLGYGYRFIAGRVRGDVEITIFDTMIRFAPPITPEHLTLVRG
jgi:hypothetical protein